MLQKDFFIVLPVVTFQTYFDESMRHWYFTITELSFLSSFSDFPVHISTITISILRTWWSGSLYFSVTKHITNSIRSSSSSSSTSLNFSLHNTNNNNVYSRTKARAYMCMIKLYTVTISTRTRMVQSTPATIGLVQAV